MAEPGRPEGVQLHAAWIGVEDVPIAFVNQVVGQLDDHGDAVLTFGQATPPILSGTEEEQRAQIAGISFVQVRPVSRITLSSQRLDQLLTLLQELADKQKAVKRALEGNGR